MKFKDFYYFTERNKHTASYDPIGYKVEDKGYRGDNYSIRFVHSFDTKHGKVNKVGVNTVAGWFTNPRGIYSYWIDDYNKGTNANFATNYDTAYILKRKPVGIQIDDIGKLSKSQYMKMNSKVKEFYEKHTNKSYEEFVKENITLTPDSQYGEKLFNTIVNIGYIPEIKAKISASEPDIVQTHIWRKILGVTFIGDKGHGIIHWKEKSQCLFLDPRAYEVVESMDNTRTVNPVLRLDMEKIEKDPKYLIGLYKHGDKFLASSLINLNHAIKTKDISIVKDFVSRGFKPSKNSIEVAFETEDPAMLKYVHSLGNVNLPLIKELVDKAAKMGDIKLLKALIDIGGVLTKWSVVASIESKNIPMIKAVAEMSHGSNKPLSTKNHPHPNPLFLAIYTKNIDVVKAVIELGAEPEKDTINSLRNASKEIIDYVSDYIQKYNKKNGTDFPFKRD